MYRLTRASTFGFIASIDPTVTYRLRRRRDIMQQRRTKCYVSSCKRLSNRAPIKTMVVVYNRYALILVPQLYRPPRSVSPPYLQPQLVLCVHYGAHTLTDIFECDPDRFDSLVRPIPCPVNFVCQLGLPTIPVLYALTNSGECGEKDMRAGCVPVEAFLVP